MAKWTHENSNNGTSLKSGWRAHLCASLRCSQETGVDSTRLSFDPPSCVSPRRKPLPLHLPPPWLILLLLLTLTNSSPCPSSFCCAPPPPSGPQLYPFTFPLSPPTRGLINQPRPPPLLRSSPPYLTSLSSSSPPPPPPQKPMSCHVAIPSCEDRGKLCWDTMKEMSFFHIQTGPIRCLDAASWDHTATPSEALLVGAPTWDVRHRPNGRLQCATVFNWSPGRE